MHNAHAPFQDKAIFSPDLAAWGWGLITQLEQDSKAKEGITRETYGAGESQAIAFIKAQAVEKGLEVRSDAACNLIVELPGTRPDLPVVACGSHLDSVPNGGNYDGAAGVVAGLMSIVAIQQSGVPQERTHRLYVLRGEESAWYRKCYLGSLALFGKLEPEHLNREHMNKQHPREDRPWTLRDAMAASGASIDILARGEALVEPSEIECYLELHIEQGPVLVERKKPVGIVTNIRGNHRHGKATCRGVAGHSGTVPRWSRRDAVFAVADFISRLDHKWRREEEQRKDLVLTFGVLQTNADVHGMSRIPDAVDFQFEYRSNDQDYLEEFQGIAQKVASDVERSRSRKRGEPEASKASSPSTIKFDLGSPEPTAPADMTSSLVHELSAICKDLDIASIQLPSGAGHDAAVFANNHVPSAMVFVRNENGSHNPNEKMERSDFMEGARVLALGLTRAPAALSRGAQLEEARAESPPLELADLAPPTKQGSNDLARRAARILFESRCVSVEEDSPVIFSSGWASPAFMNVKKLISSPIAREQLVALAKEKILQDIGTSAFDAIACGTSGGAPFATLLAREFGVPLVMIRKTEGAGARSEVAIGQLDPLKKMLLIGDLTRDGSSIRSYKEIIEDKHASAPIAFVLFDYDIYGDLVSPEERALIPIHSLLTWRDILSTAQEIKNVERFEDKLSESKILILADYMRDPVGYSRRNGGRIE